MRRRAMGLEEEYGLSVKNGEEQIHSFAASMFMINRLWHQNGACSYPDTGGHPEYAGPECDNPEDVANHSMAGRRYMSHFIDEGAGKDNQLLRLRIQGYRFALYCNNVCNYGEGTGNECTYGAHENYQCEGFENIKDFTQPLLAYLATRHLVLGAGRLRQDHQGGRWFELSQRAGFMLYDYASNTTSNRPLVNTRDEAHATNGSKRLHLISADNNIRPELTALKFGIMTVLLTMVEEGRLQGLRFPDAARVMRATSARPGRAMQLQDGRYITAVQVQQFYFDQAWEFVQRTADMAAFRPYIVRWGEQLARLEESLDPHHHAGQLDWATKQQSLERQMQKNPPPAPGAPSYTAWCDWIQERELEFHRVNGKPSAMEVVLQRFSDYPLRQPAIERAMVEPPRTTRAWARGQAVRHHAQYGWPAVVNWGSLQMPAERLGGACVALPDPLDPTVPDWREMEARSQLAA